MTLKVIIVEIRKLHIAEQYMVQEFFLTSWAASTNMRSTEQIMRRYEMSKW